MPTGLNPEQQQAVIHGDGPLLIIAGAGTGKTTVITKRIQHLIQEQHVSPSNILALTFTEKAAAEMQSRVDEVLPYGYTEMWIETFHAFCDRILRQNAIHIGLNPGFTMMTEAESLAFLRKHLFSFELEYFRPLGNPMKFLQGILQHFSRLKDDDITTRQYLDYANTLEARPAQDELMQEETKRTRELAHAYEQYENLKAKEGVMDFSDLISNTLKLFRTRKTVLREYQNLFQYILVDEFQDTNYAQNEMAILLAGEKQNITVVGDDDQAIYRWRGAALSNMLQFRSHFTDAKIITLTKNYRSSQSILDSAYQLIQYNNPDRLEIKEGIDKKLQAIQTSEKAEPVLFLYGTKAEDEAEEVAKKIQEEIKKNNRDYSDFAILIRANDHGLPFQRALDRMRIPYQFLGPGHLFEQEEIKDMVAYMHALVNFEDAAALYRVITMPIFAIQARDVAALLNFSKRSNLSVFEAMEQVEESLLTDDGKEKVTKIVEMMKKHLAKLPTDTAGQILYSFFEDSGLLTQYLDPATTRTEKEAQNIAKFFDKLKSFAANKEDVSIFAIVDWIDLSMELGESPQAAQVDLSENNAVNILTIHSSKGLEFPVVFVVNLVTQRFPGRDRKEQIPVPSDIIREVLPQGNEHLQEERRLFYVAATRAKEKLFLTAAKFYGEGKRERKLSPFITEALGETATQSVVKKAAVQQSADQLSLLDMLNETIQLEKKTVETPVEQKQFTAVTYISYSQIQTFQVCPLHYKLRYILNVPTPPSQALSYGVSVHASMRDFFELLKDETPKANAMVDILKTNWLREGYTSKAEQELAYARAEKLLIKTANELVLNKPKTIAVETPFSFWLGKVKVGGRIDRIDQLPDGRVEIIDYKTGLNVPDEKKLREDLQLTFYALAATEVHDELFNKKPEEIVLTLHYLEAGKTLSTTRTKDELELAKEKILSIVENIAQSNFHCSGGMLCKTCEYQMLCSTHR